MMNAPRIASLNAAEEGLLEYIRQHARLCRDAWPITESWSYSSPFDLLLDLGRRFTPAPSPDDLIAMPDRFCYSNSARYARAHDLVYAEGFALTHAGLDIALPHGWVVRPDGTVLDPTWDDAPGRAYVGIPVADSRLWPNVEGGGLLQDFDRTLPLLRDGFPRSALADLGRPL